MPEAIDVWLVHLRQTACSLGPGGPVAVVSQGPDAENVARYSTCAAGAMAVFASRRTRKRGSTSGSVVETRNKTAFAPR